jgi:Bacteriophage CI repressor helix-turn-helix domain
MAKKKRTPSPAPERHPDGDLLDRLEEAMGVKPIELCHELGITSQVLHNWKVRGVAPGRRGDVAKLCKAHGVSGVPRDWRRCPMCGRSGFLDRRSNHHGGTSAST